MAYLAAVKEQDGAAMSLGNVSSFLDFYMEYELSKGTITESFAQELIDQFVIKLRIDVYKRQQVSLAEQELKQVKAEIRTDKLKKTATNAATAIASGVGSLFGSGKLKELEHHIEQLHQEITKRDKATDELKIQIQQIQEQHSRQIRNLQRIHNQELEANDKEISRLSTVLEKAHKWFPKMCIRDRSLRYRKPCQLPNN